MSRPFCLTKTLIPLFFHILKVFRKLFLKYIANTLSLESLDQRVANCWNKYFAKLLQVLAEVWILALQISGSWANWGGLKLCRACLLAKAGSSVWLTTMNYVQFSLFNWVSQNMKNMKMMGPSGVMMFFSITIHLP